MNSLWDMAGWTPGLEFKNAFRVWPSLRLGVKKCIWDANPRSAPSVVRVECLESALLMWKHFAL